MKLFVSYDFLPKHSGTQAAVVMDHFGIGFETGQHVIADDLELPVEPGDVVCFTGPSGSGKSSLMRAAAESLTGVLDIDSLELGDKILVDTLSIPVEESMRSLSACGLGEAQLILRTPAELSDGQRYRFRLALGLSRQPQWLLADEFTATLDRTLAKVVAFNIRRTASRTGTGFLLATTNEIALHLRFPLPLECRATRIARSSSTSASGLQSGKSKLRCPSPSPAHQRARLMPVLVCQPSPCSGTFP